MKPHPSWEAGDFTGIHLERRSDGGLPIIKGQAAPFGSLSEERRGVRDRIEKGAYRASINGERRDVAALREHNPELLLGRQSAGTLRMKETSDGLQVEILPPYDRNGRSAVTSIERGDLRHMSCGYVVKDFELVREDGQDIRVLKDVELFDVSLVAFPAYQDTSVEIRSLEVWGRSVEFSGAWETRKNKAFLQEGGQRVARDKLLRDDSLPHIHYLHAERRKFVAWCEFQKCDLVKVANDFNYYFTVKRQFLAANRG